MSRKLTTLAAASAFMVAFTAPVALSQEAAPAAAGTEKMEAAKTHDASRHPHGRFRHHHRGPIHHSQAAAPKPEQAK